MLTDRLVDVWNGYRRDADRAYRYGESNLNVLMFIGVVVNALFYPIDVLTMDPAYDTLVIRLLGSVLCLPVLLARRFRPSWAPLLYWFAASQMLYSFNIAFLLNAASVNSLGELSPGWMGAYIVTLSLYVIGMNSPKLSLTGWLVTAGLGMATVATLDTPNWDVVHDVFTKLLGIYGTGVVFGAILLSRFDVISKEKTAAARAIGGNVAHELRTPIAGINFRAKAARKMLAELARNRTEVSTDWERRLTDVAGSLDEIAEEASHSNTIIDMLLVNTAQDPYRASTFDRFSAAEVVTEAIKRYPFASDAERSWVRAEVGNDFEIRAPRILVVHVLFNLLKNALFYVKTVDRSPCVSFTTAKAANNKAHSGTIIVADNGPGISPEAQRRMFDRFFTTSPAGTGSGIGLAFCRQVMLGIGGEIECVSEKNSGTQFVLKF